MTTQEVAEKLVKFCREGDYDSAYGLYAEDAISMEMEGVPGHISKGRDQIISDYQKWAENVQEMHGGEVGDPLVAGNHFVVPMTYDITFKDRGREQMEELCMYQVENGQIVKASYHYPLPEMFK
jgi:hypothetical protein